MSEVVQCICLNQFGALRLSQSVFMSKFSYITQLNAICCETNLSAKILPQNNPGLCDLSAALDSLRLLWYLAPTCQQHNLKVHGGQAPMHLFVQHSSLVVQTVFIGLWCTLLVVSSTTSVSTRQPLQLYTSTLMTHEKILILKLYAFNSYP